MIQKLEKNKRRYAFLFSLFSGVVLLPVLLFARNDAVRICAGIVLAANTAIALFYRRKGLAFAGMCAVYALLMYGGIALGLALDFLVPASGPKKADLLALLPFIVFTVVIPLPKYVKKRLENELDRAAKKETEAICRSDPEPEKEERMTFEMFAEYRKLKNYLEKPYSLGSCSTFVRYLRIVLGILLAVGGLTALVIGTYGEDLAADFFYSFSFWVAVSGISAIAAGLTILFAGFVRSVVVLLICGAFLWAGTYLYGFFDILSRRSMPLFLLSLLLLVVITVEVLAVVLKTIFRQTKRSFTYYEKDGALIGVDLLLKDALPLAGYGKLIRIDVEMLKTFTERSLLAFQDLLLSFAENNRLAAAGTVYHAGRSAYSAFLYTDNPQKAVRRVHGFLKRNISFPCRVTLSDDGGWEVYQRELFPSESRLMELYNERVIGSLEEQGFDFFTEHPVVFSVWFKDDGNAAAFRESALKIGFERSSRLDNGENAGESDPAEESGCLVLLQLRSRIGLERINMLCKTIMELAARHDGNFDDWDFGELPAEPEREPAGAQRL